MLCKTTLVSRDFRFAATHLNRLCCVWKSDLPVSSLKLPVLLTHKSTSSTGITIGFNIFKVF